MTVPPHAPGAAARPHQQTAAGVLHAGVGARLGVGASGVGAELAVGARDRRIPLALVGVVPGLLITGTSISVIVLMGGILLVGIVVNNAIVLIDTINRLRRDGMEKFEAIFRAGHIRLRPILMTTLTTVLGLMPMALSWGEGSELRTPLAMTVASGLLVGTVLTLVVIPAAYSVVPGGPGATPTTSAEQTRDAGPADKAKPSEEAR